MGVLAAGGDELLVRAAIAPEAESATVYRPFDAASTGAPGRSSTSSGSSRMNIISLASPKAQLNFCSPLLMKLNRLATAQVQVNIATRVPGVIPY